MTSWTLNICILWKAFQCFCATFMYLHLQNMRDNWFCRWIHWLFLLNSTCFRLIMHNSCMWGCFVTVYCCLRLWKSVYLYVNWINWYKIYLKLFMSGRFHQMEARQSVDFVPAQNNKVCFRLHHSESINESTQDWAEMPCSNLVQTPGNKWYVKLEECNVKS